MHVSDPASAGEYVPGGQGAQVATDPSFTKPGAQGKHLPEAGPAYDPGLQFVQQSWLPHREVPAGQAMHKLDPALEKYPSAHGWHIVPFTG